MPSIEHDHEVAAALNPGGSRVIRPDTVIFVGPDGSGRNTLISCLEQLNIGLRCKQHTTRPARHPGDQEHYIHISPDEFWARRSHEYILIHRREGYWYGESVTDIQQCWESGKIAFLKGPARCIAGTKTRIHQLRPQAHVLAVLVLTSPANAWMKNLAALGLRDYASYIEEGKAELEDALQSQWYRLQIDRTVTNYAGDFKRTVEVMLGVIGVTLSDLVPPEESTRRLRRAITSIG